MSVEGAVVLGVVGCSAYAVGYFCTRIWNRKEDNIPLKKQEAGGEDLTVEVSVGLSDDIPKNDWSHFCLGHVITKQECPDHDQWTPMDWEAFLRRRNIWTDHQNSYAIISVENEGEILTDFDSPFLSDRFEKYTRYGNVYKSIHERTIFHVKWTDNKEMPREVQVIKTPRICYSACVDTTNLGSLDNPQVVRTPVRFESPRLPPATKLDSNTRDQLLVVV